MPRRMAFRKKSFKRTFSKSAGRKRYKSRGKKSRYSKIKKSRSKGRSKLSIARQLASVMLDQVYMDNYPDLVSVAGTANQKATQFIWGAQQLSSQTDSIQQPPYNLMCHDPSILQQIMAQQIRYAAGTDVVALGGAPTAQVLIKNWKVSAKIKNVETGDIELIHYRCKARRDLTSINGSGGINTILNTGPTDTSFQSGPATGITPQILATTYGAEVFDNPRFTAAVQVLYSKKYYMKPNKCITLSFSKKSPRLWKTEDFNFGAAPDADGSTSTARTCLKGQTFSVFVIRGTFATNSANTAGYRVGAGNAAVGILYSHKVHYAVITPSVMQTSANNALPGFGFGGCAYPLPIVATQPFSTINETTGVRVLGTTFPDTINDSEMTN